MNSGHSALSKSPGRRLADGFGNLILRILPLVVALVAFVVAGRAKADLANIRTLMQLSLGVVAGVASYTIITEITLSRLPRRLSQELDLLADELRPLNASVTELSANVGELSDTVNDQVRALTDLHGMEVLFDHQDALARARSLQNDAERSITAMWTNVPYDETLQQYFSETLARSPYSVRIVAADSVSQEDLLDHIEKSWSHLATGKYEIFLVQECSYEALVIDRSTAALFIYSEKGYGSCFLSSPTKEFVDAVEGLIDSLKRSERRLPVGRNETNDLSEIRTWIGGYYASMQ